MAEATPAPAPDIIASIDRILAADKAPAPEPKQQAAPEPAPAAEQAAPVEGEEQPPEDYQPETNQIVEGEEAPPADERAVAEIPLDQLEAIALDVTYKGDDGKDVTEKLTIKELREGSMRQKDYSRKTAELARQRDEVGEKVRQAIDSERNRYQQTLQQLQNALIDSVAPELKDVNWNHLATNDPAEYVRLRNRADQVSQVLGQIQSKTAEVSKKQALERDQALKKAAAESRAKLEADIPGFGDDLYQKLIKSGAPYGYKTEELAQWVDHRAIKLLHDAYQYQQQKAKPVTAAQRVVNVPKVIKPGAAQPSRAQAQATEALNRLTKSGKLEDAAAVIRSRMG